MVEQIFLQAAQRGQLVELTDHDGNRRIVEPYVVYISSRHKRLLHFFQRSGFSASNRPCAWKNLEVSSFAKASVLDSSFTNRPDYNPANRRMFPVIVFARPKVYAALA